MSSKPQLASTLFVVCLFLMGTAPQSQDWNQWMGSGRDGKTTVLKTPSIWPSELTPVFTFPVIAGQYIYIKDAEHLICYSFN